MLQRCDMHGVFGGDHDDCPFCQWAYTSSTAHVGRDTLFPWPSKFIAAGIGTFLFGATFYFLFMR